MTKAEQERNRRDVFAVLRRDEYGPAVDTKVVEVLPTEIEAEREVARLRRVAPAGTTYSWQLTHSYPRGRHALDSSDPSIAFRHRVHALVPELDERALLLLFRIAPQLLPGRWQLEAENVRANGGFVDFLFRTEEGVNAVVEVKRGHATRDTVDRVKWYTDQLAKERQANQYEPWVFSQQAAKAVRRRADSEGVSLHLVDNDQIERALVDSHLPPADILRLSRDIETPSHPPPGGAIPIGIAYKELPPAVVGYLTELEHRHRVFLHAGRQQIEISYRGIRLGGIYRRKVEAVVTTALVSSEAAHQLLTLGFRQTTTSESTRSARTRYTIDAIEIDRVRAGFDVVSTLVDDLHRSPNAVLSASRSLQLANSVPAR